MESSLGKQSEWCNVKVQSLPKTATTKKSITILVCESLKGLKRVYLHFVDLGLILKPKEKRRKKKLLIIVKDSMLKTYYLIGHISHFR
jgi:hypothetical protein